MVCPAAGATAALPDPLGPVAGATVALPAALRSAISDSMSRTVPGAFEGASPDVALRTSEG